MNNWKEIFSISLADYCSTKGTTPRDYDIVGIHFSTTVLDLGAFERDMKANVGINMGEVEAIVDYQPYGVKRSAAFGSEIDHFHNGTALIRRKDPTPKN